MTVKTAFLLAGGMGVGWLLIFGYMSSQGDTKARSSDAASSTSASRHTFQL